MPPRATSRIIESDADILAGVRSLRRRCEIMRAVHTAAGNPPLRRRPAGFDGLARIVVGQQLSIQSAAAIWARVEAVASPLTPKAVLRATDDDLRAAGLSRGKILTLRAAAEAVAGGLALDALHGHSEEEIHDALTAVRGIGPWTADIYIMFCLGRADAFAGGDLALQIAAQRAFALDERPSALELVALAERWRPWRGVAARLLWSYYAHLKELRAAEPV